jgi:hypothetical protein
MQVGFDMKGQYNAQFPKSDKVTPIFTLAGAFLAKEDELDEGERTVYTEGIRELFATVDASLEQKSTGESQRAISSEEVKALDKKSVELIKKIHRTMNYEFGETPAEATKWGSILARPANAAARFASPRGVQPLSRL